MLQEAKRHPRRTRVTLYTHNNNKLFRGRTLWPRHGPSTVKKTKKKIFARTILTCACIFTKKYNVASRVRTFIFIFIHSKCMFCSSESVRIPRNRFNGKSANCGRNTERFPVWRNIHNILRATIAPSRYGSANGVNQNLLAKSVVRARVFFIASHRQIVQEFKLILLWKSQYWVDFTTKQKPFKKSSSDQCGPIGGTLYEKHVCTIFRRREQS